MNLRIKNTLLALKKSGLGGLIVSWPANISYLTGFTSRDAYLLISDKENIYFTDSRYTEEVKPKLKKISALRKTNGSVFKSIADSCLELGLKQAGFEERYLPFAEFKKIKDGLKNSCGLVPTHSIIEELRQLKEPGEIENIRNAVQITAKALKFAAKFLRPGRKEIEVVAELERFIRHAGAGNCAFETIVASGPNSSFPHHIPSKRKIMDNEPVMIDMGVDCNGYKSDLTRVFFLGKIKSLCSKIYEIVRRAQLKSIEKINPGILIKDIDRAGRQLIAKAGYAEFFGHNLGHGIGLEVHEQPHISAKENFPLQAGMVFTVEPAIYLPGKFGIRIEDMVLVTKNGCEVLSGSVNK